MQRTLIFPSLIELNNYLKELKHNSVTADYNNYSLTGKFDQKELNLAEKIYHAVIIVAK